MADCLLKAINDCLETTDKSYRIRFGFLIGRLWALPKEQQKILFEKWIEDGERRIEGKA